MDATTFAHKTIQDSGNQILACLAGVTEEMAVAKPIEQAMSLREMVGHLLEASIAIQSMATGGTHEWGSVSDPGGDFASLLQKFREERTKAIDIALNHIESSPEFAQAYLIGHEYYHVGQMVTNRLTQQPDWDHYSIYQS